MPARNPLFQLTITSPPSILMDFLFAAIALLLVYVAFLVWFFGGRKPRDR